MSSIVNIYDAKTQLSALVDRAAGGEEIIIAKNGAPKAKLVSIPHAAGPRVPAHAMGVHGLDLTNPSTKKPGRPE